MKLAHSLYLETLALLILYLTALIAVVFIAFNTHFGAGWDALMQSPLGDKVDTVGDAVSNQLRSSPEKKWDEVLNLFGGLYHLKFAVFDIHGQQVAGEKIKLPGEVLQQFAMPMPPFAGRVMAQRAFTVALPTFSSAARAIEGVHIGKDFRPGFHKFQVAPFPGSNIAPHVVPFEGPPHDVTFDIKPSIIKPSTLKPIDTKLLTKGTFTKVHPIPGEAGVAFGYAASPMAMSVMSFPRAPMPAHGRFLIHTKNPDHYFFGTRIDLMSETFFRPGPSILVASTDNIWQTGLLLDFKVLAMAGGAIAVLSILFWLPFIYRITRALSDLTLATERIAEGKFDTRLETRRKDEIGRLSEAVNAMAEKLNGFVGGQKRFLADISHELFSPLARLHVALEILDGNSSKDQKALIEDIREEVEEMNHLVNELIAFSKAELKGQSRNLVSVNLDEMFYELVNRLNLKERAQIDVAENLCVVGDRLLLERSFSNVLRNSVRYAGNSGPIAIKALTAGDSVSILIQDRGPGVPAEALKHLAEPFFRPEPSRSRESGGVGLGLAIVKSCVEACGGKLQVRNREGGGLEVEVTLKAATEPDAACAVDASIAV